MRLCVNSFKTIGLAAMMAASVSACKRPTNLVPMPKEFVQPKTTAIIDSLVREGKKVSENPDYVYLGCDTLELNKDFSKNPSKFFDKTELILRDKFNDKMCTNEYDHIYSDPDGAGIIHYKDYKNIYINKTAIISSPETYTRDSADVFIPVEYYGQINPEIQNFL